MCVTVLNECTLPVTDYYHKALIHKNAGRLDRVLTYVGKKKELPQHRFL